MDAMTTIDLGWLFPEKLETYEQRDPLFVFGLPFTEGDFGLYALSIMFWVELLALVVMQGLFMAALSTITYKHIIQKRKTTMSYLVGYGVVIPLIVFVPYYQTQVLDVRNKILKFCLSAVLPTLNIFRCTEAMYGFEPRHASSSMGMYALYCGSPMELIYNTKEKKLVKSTTKDVIKHLEVFGGLMLATGLLKSFLFLCDVVPFSDAPPWENSNEAPWYSLARMFSVQQLRINAAHALLFQIYLTLFGQGVAAATSLGLGYEPIIFMHNPVLKSTSPSEFWGKRWNTLVHGVLKRGVFKPFRRFFSKPVAVFLVFLVSGIFHEWILSTVFFQHHHELDATDGACNPPNCFNPRFGSQTAFFLWNALLVALESLTGGWVVFGWIKQTLPSPMVAMLIVSMALPVVHWFCDPYVHSDFFLDGMYGVPVIKRIPA